MDRIARRALSTTLSTVVVLSITGYGTWVSWPYVLSYGRSLPSAGFEAAVVWIPITVLAMVTFLGGTTLWLWGIESISEDFTYGFHILWLPIIALKIFGCGALGTVVLYALLTMG